MNVRKHIVVSGRVQGVGFRFRTSHAAQALGLTGWVRNDPEGTVSMELQGEEELIYRLIPMLEQGSWVRIDEFYIPVAVYAGVVPTLGMLMLPKTICYMILIGVFLKFQGGEKKARQDRA